MSKIIVFTDPHMVKDGERIIGIDPHARLASGIAHVNRHHRDADLVVITGDLAHRGDVESYARLRALLDGLEIPCRLMLGNHDQRESFAQVFPDSPRDENGFFQQRLEIGGNVLLLLDTLSGPPYGAPAVYHGLLCDRRLDWLDRNLAQAGDRPVYLFMHHPPHDTGFPGMDLIKLRDGERFHDLLARHGTVRHIFAGHVHRTISGSHRGIPFAVFKSPAHQMPMNFDTHDVTVSVDEPASYGIVLLKPQGCLVHVEDYELARPAHSSYVIAG